MPRYFVDGLSTSGSPETVTVEFADEETARVAVLTRKMLGKVSTIRRAPDGVAVYTIKVRHDGGKEQTVCISAGRLDTAIDKCRAQGLRPLSLKRIDMLGASPGSTRAKEQPAAPRAKEQPAAPRSQAARPPPAAPPTADQGTVSLELASMATACMSEAGRMSHEHPLHADSFEDLAPGFLGAHSPEVVAKLLVAAGCLHAVDSVITSTKQSTTDSLRPAWGVLDVATSELRRHVPQYRRKADGTPADSIDVLVAWAADDDYLGYGEGSRNRLVGLIVELVGRLGAAEEGQFAEQFKILHGRIVGEMVRGDGYVSAAEYRAVQSHKRLGEMIDERTATLRRGGGAGVDGAIGDLELARRELDELIGLEAVKAEVRRFEALLHVSAQKREAGFPVSRPSLHFIFTGNPGTGKTTVARIIGRLLKGYGVLRKGHVVEVARSDLVGAYLGQTAIKTAEKVAEALDGVLFIDEAYALNRSDQPGDTYGDEAVEEILRRMENHRDRLVVVAAGYPAEMAKFLNMNPGLKSRFTRFLRFADYSPQQLTEIFLATAEREHYRVSPEGLERLEGVIADMHAARDATFGNAREVRNLFESALGHQALRLAAMGRRATAEELHTLDPADIAAPA